MKIAELEVMYVAEEFRSKGAGRALVNEFYNWTKARDCNRARVIASAGNIRAAKFYRESGFEDYTATFEREI
jgi:GNAT superfamily N-acetyltransferase